MITNVTESITQWGRWTIGRVSDAVYGSLQRAVAIGVLTNQRFNFSPFVVKELDQKRERIFQPNLLKKDLFHADPIGVKISTPSQNALDGVILPYGDSLKGSAIEPKIQGRLVVCFSGIGGCYEKWFEDGLQELRNEFHATLLMVNYRGVGRSTGVVTKPEDLFEDGYSVARFAIDQLALDRSKVHIYGTSMGGGVALNVAKRLEKEGVCVPTVCIDRSYASLVETVYEAIPFSYLKSMVCSVMRYTHWQIDSIASALSLKTSKLVVIRSNIDRVIPSSASLATELENRTEGMANFKVIDLPSDEKTELEKIDDPAFPKEQREYLKNTYRGKIALLAIKIRSFYQKLCFGFNAHLTPFSKKIYPLQCLIYEHILHQAEMGETEKDRLGKQD